MSTQRALTECHWIIVGSHAVRKYIDAVPELVVDGRGGTVLICRQKRTRQIQQMRHIMTPHATVNPRTMTWTVRGSQSSDVSSQRASTNNDIFTRMVNFRFRVFKKYRNEPMNLR